MTQSLDLRSVRDAALEAHAAGLCVVPPMEDGSKRPMGSWKKYQSQRPSLDELQGFYENGRNGVGVVCGRVSGNLDVLEFDAAGEVYEDFKAAAEAIGRGELVQRIDPGYSERTPSGGVHWLYRCSEIGGNQKLAQRRKLPEEKEHDKDDFQVLIETRGESGYCILAPSFGPVHPTGRPYELLHGSVATITTITPLERQDLHALARSFDQVSSKDIRPDPFETHRTRMAPDSGRPGDDFNKRATWQEVLEPHGWRAVYERAGVTYWRRPGKEIGHSATTGWAGTDYLYVFSTSTDFEANRGYSKFSAYAILQHGGDFQAAARELAMRGFGGEGFAQPSDLDWEPPTPFFQAHVPSFPTEVLPSWLQSFVEAEAVATQTPPDLAAMLALAALSAACAKKVVVWVTDGWQEPVVVFVVIALASGNRKTAVLADAAAPIEQYEQAEAKRLAPEVAEAQSNYRVTKSRLEHLQAQAAKAKPGEGNDLAMDAAEIARQLTTLDVPTIPRLIVDDCTPERLSTLLSEQDGRLAVLSAEGDIFDLMAARYGNSPNFGVFLRGHSGDNLRVDRVGRPPEFVRAPALTLGLAVQPDAVRGLVKQPGFRGRGLLARFLYSWPKSLLGQRRVDPPPVAESVRKAYDEAMLDLLRLPFALDDNGEAAAGLLSLDPAAKGALHEFEAWLEPQLGEFGELAMMTDWAGKLVGAVVRIAGLLHMAEHHAASPPWRHPISPAVVRAAIHLGYYMIDHARVAFAEMGADEEVEDAKHVLRWLERAGVQSFTKRDIYQGTKGRFKRVELLEPALRLLAMHGYIREQAPEERGGAGRKPSPVYQVNPLWRTDSGNIGNSGDKAEESKKIDHLSDRLHLDSGHPEDSVPAESDPIGRQSYSHNSQYSHNCSLNNDTQDTPPSPGDSHPNGQAKKAQPTGTDQSPAPTRPCTACGGSKWWQRRDGGWVCGHCHPQPGEPQ